MNTQGAALALRYIRSAASLTELAGMEPKGLTEGQRDKVNRLVVEASARLNDPERRKAALGSIFARGGAFLDELGVGGANLDDATREAAMSEIANMREVEMVREQINEDAKVLQSNLDFTQYEASQEKIDKFIGDDARGVMEKIKDAAVEFNIRTPEELQKAVALGMYETAEKSGDEDLRLKAKALLHEVVGGSTSDRALAMAKAKYGKFVERVGGFEGTDMLSGKGLAKKYLLVEVKNT